MGVFYSDKQTIYRYGKYTSPPAAVVCAKRLWGRNHEIATAWT